MRIIVNSMAALALAACHSGSAPADPSEAVQAEGPQQHANQQQSTASEFAPVETFVGEWRVAGIDGEALDIPFGLALSISESQIVFAAHCGGWAWDYSLNVPRLSTSVSQTPDPRCQTRAPPPTEVFAVATALSAAEYVGRTPSNGMRIEGGEHSITLYSQ